MDNSQTLINMLQHSLDEAASEHFSLESARNVTEYCAKPIQARYMRLVKKANSS